MKILYFRYGSYTCLYQSSVRVYAIMQQRTEPSE